MTWGWARRFHHALTRPFRRPDVDHAARVRVAERQRLIAARLAGYRQVRWQGDLRRREEA